MNLPSLGDIKRLRKKVGMTQSELADRAGVSQPLIARIESLDIDPRFSTFKKIYETLQEAEKERINAGDVMHSPVITVKCYQELKDAIEVMRDSDFSQIPVIDKHGVPIGSVCESTIINELDSTTPERIRDKKVEDVMGSCFPTVTPVTDLEVVLGMLEYTPAILVTEKGKLVGVITKHDIMKVAEEK
ncbi:putative transcriptional regulator with C-terminal CBS domain [Methanonatronarchaeum thermophilum]|uniref:Putative transcriptional regulator with C-terminal CBS domain n=1 Tax=Methanonatronarchaeum thermophilum TaxID=1927129 RepID=A0A1Y3GE41_9EURY|nr:CBS domain-containing protein [Methanonatronarchaeum thermophilum]OUJ18464.1 putative transcriptional regulator with C-terminal CBS domain [Methanonatronarchaeum thermophilum]